MPASPLSAAAAPIGSRPVAGQPGAPSATWHLGIPLGLTLAAGWGLGVGLWTPRGPLTTAAALTTMAVSLAVGIVAGFAMRSRWSLLVVPVVFAVVFELCLLYTSPSPRDRS